MLPNCSASSYPVRSVPALLLNYLADTFEALFTALLKLNQTSLQGLLYFHNGTYISALVWPCLPAKTTANGKVGQS
jgi:hypothetical protein